MSDLISRAEVIASIRECAEAAHSNHEWDMEQGYLNAIECIEEEPSAEPKHGKWIPVRSYEAFGGDKIIWEIRGNPIAFYYCSNCRNDAYAGEDGESLLTKYCPECGAKMEAEHETD